MSPKATNSTWHSWLLAQIKARMLIVQNSLPIFTELINVSVVVVVWFMLWTTSDSVNQVLHCRFSHHPNGRFVSETLRVIYTVS